jgi:hypothetical protein
MTHEPPYEVRIENNNVLVKKQNEKSSAVQIYVFTILATLFVN